MHVVALFRPPAVDTTTTTTVTSAAVVAFFAYVTRVVDATGHTSSVVEARTILSRYAPSSRTMTGMCLLGIAVATVAVVIKKYHR